MRQTWRDLTFLHWRCDPALLRSLIPEELSLDSIDGECWVGLVPFTIADLTLPKAPSLPWLSSFPETNVRTYVKDRNGEPGVWFFSLDASRALAVAAARMGYGLPYFWAAMSIGKEGNRIRYRSKRIFDRGAESDVEVEVGDPCPDIDEITHFLTARFRLYAQRNGQLVFARIQHQPWPLRQAKLLRLNQSLMASCGLPAPTEMALAHYSDVVHVLAGPPVIANR